MPIPSQLLESRKRRLDTTRGRTPATEGQDSSKGRFGSISLGAGVRALQRISDPSRVHGREALPPNLKDADLTTGADLSTRLALGAKLTEQGRLNYLKENFDVAVDRDKGVFIREKPTEGKDAAKWVLVNPQDGILGFDVGDIAEALPAVAQAIPGVVGSAIGAAGGPVGVAAGGAVGDLVSSVGRQAASAFLPGSDELTVGERAAMVGADVAAVAPWALG